MKPVKTLSLSASKWLHSDDKLVYGNLLDSPYAKFAELVELPQQTMTTEQAKAKGYFIVEGRVYNLKDFASCHPGGEGPIMEAMLEKASPGAVFSDGHAGQVFASFAKRLEVATIATD